MTSRDPALRHEPLERGEPGGGGMTGATGSLTPDEIDEPFVPAELREVTDPDAHASATHTAERRPEEPPSVAGSSGAGSPAGTDERSSSEERY